MVASYGHVRDLPAKDGSVKPDQDFAMEWEIGDRSARPLDAIAQALKSADNLILATDPDREGEAISWHVLELLKDRKLLGGRGVERVTFNEITKTAIQEGVPPSPRDQPRTGRRLSGAPGAGLSGGIHAVAGAVAQAAGRALGGAGPVGRAPADLRARG